MSRTTGVNASRIKAVFRSCVFTPAKPGPMKIIADVGDPQYYIMRASEILETQIQGKHTKDTDELRKAIGLLALAVAEIELNEPDHN